MAQTGEHEAPGPVRRSRLAEYAELAGPPPGAQEGAAATDPEAAETPEFVPGRGSVHTHEGGAESSAEPDVRAGLAEASAWAEGALPAGVVEDPRVVAGRLAFDEVLEEFRATAVLVPLEGGGLWTARSGGVRWICAFTDEVALARFAVRQKRSGQSWEYASLLGSRLLDAVIPAIGEPAGVAVDVGDEGRAMFFPPVVGIVPDEAAVTMGRKED